MQWCATRDAAKRPRDEDQVNESAPLALQYGVLPWRRSARGPQVLLVTSRISHKWLLPKGWLIPGLSSADSACREAFEEAGVEGEVGGPLGQYGYIKITRNGRQVPCSVTLFGLRVHRLLRNWPERDERTRRWFALQKAPEMVAEPGLRDLLEGLDRNAFPAD
jgi:8-oxo-dGTP pyrophosphatase MutT (NUDIX family)